MGSGLGSLQDTLPGSEDGLAGWFLLGGTRPPVWEAIPPASDTERTEVGEVTKPQARGDEPGTTAYRVGVVQGYPKARTYSAV